MLSLKLNSLIQAVRDLGLEISKGTDTITIKGSVESFPSRLTDLQRALEEYDKSESNKAEDSYSYLLMATGAFVSKAKKSGDRRTAYQIVNDAIEKHGNEAWAESGFDPNKISKKHPLKSANAEMGNALKSAEKFKSKSLAKAKKDIQKRDFSDVSKVEKSAIKPL
jgi:hypothetical protein